MLNEKNANYNVYLSVSHFSIMMNYLNTMNKGSFHKRLLLLLTLFIISIFVFFFFNMSINADASYYIGVSRLISEGMTPFSDFRLHYSPLSFYIMSVPFYIFGTSYTCAISVLYLIHFVNSFLIYKILRNQQITKEWAWLGSLLFLLSCVLFQGSCYVLEPFVVCFGLLAFTFLKKESVYNLLCAGFFCSCSFLCKQYGIGYLFLLMFFVVRIHSRIEYIKKGGYVLLGFAIGLCLFTVFMKIQGIDILLMLDNLSGSDYHKDGIRGLFRSLFFLFVRFPHLPISLVLALVYYKFCLNNHFWLVSLIGLIGFLLACYVRSYHHYILLASPFMVFLITSTYSQIAKTYYKKVYALLIKASTIITVCFVVILCHDELSKNDRNNQIAVSRQLENYIPRNQNGVFVSFSMLYVTLLNSYTPPLIDKYGLSNGFLTDPLHIQESINHANYIVLNEQDIAYKKKVYNEVLLTSINNSFDKSIIDDGFNHNIIIYRRKPNK